MKKKLTTFFCLLFMLFPASEAKTIYVNQNASGGNNGTNWENAYTSLSTALSNATSGDEIRVAKGVYKPAKQVDLDKSGGENPREATFQIPDSVQLYGGFLGNETNIDQRDWENNKTILSGDIDNNDNDPDEDGLIDKVEDIKGENAYHVVLTVAVSTCTLLDGFVINAGNANKESSSYNDPNNKGGGWFNDAEIAETSPNLKNITFLANASSHKGGAIFYTVAYDSHIISHIINCTFIKNESGEGGAMFSGSNLMYIGFNLHFKNCTFSMNKASEKGGALCLSGDNSVIDSCYFLGNISGKGGAVYLKTTSTNFNNCVFSENTSVGSGGGALFIHADYNESIQTSLGTPEFTNCVFYKNKVEEGSRAAGGAVLNLSKNGILESGFVNCIFYKNKASGNGGAIANFAEAHEESTSKLFTNIINCTLSQNQAAEDGGAIYNYSDFVNDFIFRLHIVNSILWKDSASNENTREIYTNGFNGVSYSLIEGCGGSGANWNSTLGIDEGGNLNADPLLREISLPHKTAGPALSPYSPAINKGDNVATNLTGINYDIIGNQRIQEEIVDMGALEVKSAMVPQQGIIYVDQKALGANNGSCWKDAFTSLSAALKIAKSGDTIWVAKGVYKPETIIFSESNGNADPRQVTFRIPDSVQLFGGFLGIETTLDQRDWENNKTILSGDIDKNDIDPDGDGIPDNADDIRGKNAYHVIYTMDVSKNTVVDGFIITAGSADSDQNSSGGGWFNQIDHGANSSPTIINNTFRGNYAKLHGGALYSNSKMEVAELNSYIFNCSFIGNISRYAGGAISMLNAYAPGPIKALILQCQFIKNETAQKGGAIYFYGDNSQVQATSFIDNVSLSKDSGKHSAGGAIYLSSSGTTFNSCVFRHNSTKGSSLKPEEFGGGGAAYIQAEDGVIQYGPLNPSFISCTFYKNVAGGNIFGSGGAVFCLSNTCMVHPFFVNCMFYKNSAQDNGGAVAIYGAITEAIDPYFDPVFVNCTFSDNHAIKKGGALYNEGFVLNDFQMLSTRLENCILWNNTATAEDEMEIYNTGDLLISYSIVKGSGGSGPDWNFDLGIDGSNNLDENPLFMVIELPYGTFGKSISNSSPAINAGTSNATRLLYYTTDLIGNPRFQCNTVDIGAIETQQCAITNIKNENNEDFSMFPMPAEKFLKIKSKLLSSGNCTIRIINMNGIILKQYDIQSFNEEFEIDVSTLSSGIYGIQLNSENTGLAKSFVVK